MSASSALFLPSSIDFYSLCCYPTTLPTIPPLSSCHLIPPHHHHHHQSLLQLCLLATFISPFSFHPAFSSFPPNFFSTPLLYSLCCLSSPVLPLCFVSFNFLSPWLAFLPSNPQPISLNLFFSCFLHLSLHSFFLNLLYFGPFLSWFKIHLSLLFSRYLLLFSC